jgi:hypothetical protein
MTVITVTSNFLSTLCVPPAGIIKVLLSQTKQHWLDGAQSICLPGQNTLFPLWAPFFWNEVQVITPIWESWCAAVLWVRQKELSHFQTEVHNTLIVLSSLTWSGHIPCAIVTLPKTTLIQYLSCAWLSDEQIDQMLNLLQAEI